MNDKELRKFLGTDEREVNISQTADNRNEWEVYTDDPTMIKKFRRLTESEGIKYGVGFKFVLYDWQMSFKKVRKKKKT